MIQVRRDDLVTAEVECVLRTVSSRMEPVTSLGRAVGAAAGADLEERIERMGELPVGGAVITPGGALQAAFMVHVVVQSDDEPVTAAGVRRAFLNGLRHACRLGVETLALPPLGTGAGNLDAEAAADVMAQVLREHLEREEYPKQVIVMVTTDYELQVFATRLKELDDDREESSGDAEASGDGGSSDDEVASGDGAASGNGAANGDRGSSGDGA